MILAAALLVALTAQAPSAAPDYTLLEIQDAIRTVETRGAPNSGRDTGGDGGRAIGPFQIHFAYWKDAGLPGQYEDCRDLDYARRVVLAYWRRYCPKALLEHEAEALARTHNGGPAGAKHDSTLRFWKKVQVELERARKNPGPERPAKSEEKPAKIDETSRRGGTEIALVPPILVARTISS
jgi:Destabilase